MEIMVDYFMGYELMVTTEGVFIHNRRDSLYGNTKKFPSIDKAYDWILQHIKTN